MGRTDTSQSHSPASILAALKRIEALLTAPRRVAEAMESLGIQSAVVKYQQSLEDTFESLRRWGTACEQALTEAQKLAGHFQADPVAHNEAGDEKPKPPRRKVAGL